MKENTLISENPVVSVVMITYKHEAFIAEAIEGVLMQEVDFPVELIIADDCSPDKTQEIIVHYIDTHPKGHWIKYTRHQQNKGMMPNFVWAMQQAKGEYIALCEGDDYWTDSLKLQKQVIFLEEHKEYALSFHRVNYISSFEKLIELYSPDLIKSTFNTEDLIQDNLIPTPSVVFRNVLTDLSFLESCPVGDYPMFLMISLHGKLHYENKAMATYRRHEGGIWVSKTNREMLASWIKMQDYLIKLLPTKYHDMVLDNQIIRLREYFKLLDGETEQFAKDFPSIPISIISLPERFISLRNQSTRRLHIWLKIKQKLQSFKK